MDYALEGVKDDSPIYAGSGERNYPEEGWYRPTSNGLFQIDSNNTLSYLIGFTDSWFGIGKQGVIPIGAINEARSLYPVSYTHLAVFVCEDVVVWRCRNCGHLHIGTSAPTVCPVCAHPQAYFEVKPDDCW